MWRIGPHNDTMLRLYRFKDAELEKQYRLHSNKSCVLPTHLHGAIMTLLGALSCFSYIGGSLTLGFWLYFAVSVFSLLLVLCVYLCATARRHIIPLHSIFCCILASLFSVMIPIQYIAWAQSADALRPQGYPWDITEPLEVFTKHTLVAHSILFGLVWASSQWIPLSLMGMNVWSASAYCYSFVSFGTCAFVCPCNANVLANAIFFAILILAAFLIFGFVLEQARRANFLAQTQLAHEMQASQLADSMLNHTLKNILADVAANLEVYLASHGELTLLEDCIVCLRRGMQSCRDRQTYLALAAGEYQPTLSQVCLSALAHQLVASRPVTVQAPDTVVLLDVTLVALILENAISNAFQHGCQLNPDVHLTITELRGSPGEGESATQQHLHFIVTNAADPLRPSLTPEHACQLLVRKDYFGADAPTPAPAGLSCRIGLSHCVLAAERGGIRLHLAEEHNRVAFTASLNVPLTLSGPFETAALPLETRAGPHQVPSPPSLPPGLCFCCIDDSVAAQRLLAFHIRSSFPSSTVHCFGATDEDLTRFLACAIASADVVILDQHLDSGHTMHYGTDLLRQLLAHGYRGLACIRSANDSADDRARYAACGAHCTIGKDVLGARMMAELAVAYAKLSGADQPPRAMGSGSPPSLVEPCGATSTTTSLPALPDPTCGSPSLTRRPTDIILDSHEPRPHSDPTPYTDSPWAAFVEGRRPSLPGVVRMAPDHSL